MPRRSSTRSWRGAPARWRPAPSWLRCAPRARPSPSWSAWRGRCGASPPRSRSSRDDLVDTAGTGGGPSTFNISTTAALVAAGAGCAVAKHGNRSSTSRSARRTCSRRSACESTSGPPAVARCIDEVGFGFMFAPRHHAAMKHVAPVRKELAVRTIFNFLGPLTNPAGASRQLLGVSDRRYQETIAEALVGLGCKRAMVVRAEDGVDEIGLAGPTRVIEVRDGRDRGVVHRAGGARCLLRRCRRDPGGTPEENAATVSRVLDGEEGPARDVVVLNAAAAIVVGRRCGGPRGRGRARSQGNRLGGSVRRARPPRRAQRRAGRIVTQHWLACWRMSSLEELVAGAREDARRRQEEVSLDTLRARLVEREGRAPIQRGARASRAFADRRVQAALAERRRPAARCRRRGRPCAHTSAAARPRSRS